MLCVLSVWVVLMFVCFGASTHVSSGFDSRIFLGLRGGIPRRLASQDLHSQSCSFKTKYLATSARTSLWETPRSSERCYFAMSRIKASTKIGSIPSYLEDNSWGLNKSTLPDISSRCPWPATSRALRGVALRCRASKRLYYTMLWCNTTYYSNNSSIIMIIIIIYRI